MQQAKNYALVSLDSDKMLLLCGSWQRSDGTARQVLDGP